MEENLTWWQKFIIVVVLSPAAGGGMGIILGVILSVSADESIKLVTDFGLIIGIIYGFVWGVVFGKFAIDYGLKRTAICIISLVLLFTLVPALQGNGPGVFLLGLSALLAGGVFITLASILRKYSRRGG